MKSIIANDLKHPQGNHGPLATEKMSKANLLTIVTATVTPSNYTMKFHSTVSPHVEYALTERLLTDTLEHETKILAGFDFASDILSKSDPDDFAVSPKLYTYTPTANKCKLITPQNSSLIRLGNYLTTTSWTPKKQAPFLFKRSLNYYFAAKEAFTPKLHTQLRSAVKNLKLNNLDFSTKATETKDNIKYELMPFFRNTLPKMLKKYSEICIEIDEFKKEATVASLLDHEDLTTALEAMEDLYLGNSALTSQQPELFTELTKRRDMRQKFLDLLAKIQSQQSDVETLVNSLKAKAEYISNHHTTSLTAQVVLYMELIRENDTCISEKRTELQNMIIDADAIATDLVLSADLLALSLGDWVTDAKTHFVTNLELTQKLDTLVNVGSPAVTSIQEYKKKLEEIKSQIASRSPSTVSLASTLEDTADHYGALKRFWVEKTSAPQKLYHHNVLYEANWTNWDNVAEKLVKETGKSASKGISSDLEDELLPLAIACVGLDAHDQYHFTRDIRRAILYGIGVLDKNLYDRIINWVKVTGNGSIDEWDFIELRNEHETPLESFVL